MIRRPILVGVALVAAIGAASITMRLAAQSGPGQPARGKDVYDRYCADCHGPTGQGDGPAAFLLSPRPRDLTSAKYKIRTTETGSLPTDEDLVRAISQGLYGSAMPAWRNILSEDDIRVVAGSVKSFSPRFAREVATAIRIGPSIASSPDSIVRGAAVYERLQCGKCHGTDGRGAGAVATTFEDDWRQPLRAADLTEPWSFHGGSTSTEIFMRFRAGMSGTPMPSFKDAATDAEMWDLANYVVSLARKPVWQMTAEEVAALYARLDAEARANPVKRGEYLVDTLGCALCHSPVDSEKKIIPGMKLAGGLRIHVEPYGDFPTGNLTSDQETGLGSWSDDEIKRAITQGILKDGTRLLPFPMDWPSFGTMKDEDVKAIVAYLRSVPAVRNRVPAPRWTVLPLHLWGKFRLLILGSDPPISIYAGNAGRAE